MNRIEQKRDNNSVGIIIVIINMMIMLVRVNVSSSNRVIYLEFEKKGHLGIRVCVCASR